MNGELQEARASLLGASRPARGSKLVMAPGKGRKRFVCFDEDVTIKNLDQACELGFDAPSWRSALRPQERGRGRGVFPGLTFPWCFPQYHCGTPGIADATTVAPPLAPTLLATYAGTPMISSSARRCTILRRSWERFSIAWGLETSALIFSQIIVAGRKSRTSR